MDELKVHIVDDEPLARQRLERLLAEQPGIRISGSSASASQALEACQRDQPDVLLLDVEMPGDDGLELARQFSGAERAPAIIFTTAFEDYAVDAFAVRALDYLIKPVRPGRLGQALQRAREARKAAGSSRSHLSARVGDRLVVIPAGEIRLLLAEDKYTCIHHLKGTALVEESLVSLEAEYPQSFFRIHRNALVARDHVRELFRDEAGRTCVKIDDCEVAPEVSRRNLPSLKRLLTGAD